MCVAFEERFLVVFDFSFFFLLFFVFFLDRYTAVSGDVTMRTSGQTAGATVSDLTKKNQTKNCRKKKKERERERERENAVEKIFLSKMKNDEPIGFSVARAVSSHLPRFHILKKRKTKRQRDGTQSEWLDRVPLVGRDQSEATPRVRTRRRLFSFSFLFGFQRTPDRRRDWEIDHHHHQQQQQQKRTATTDPLKRKKKRNPVRDDERRLCVCWF